MADIESIIRQAADRYGIEPSTLLRIGEMESGLNPNAMNPNSSAIGLFQFLDSTAQDYGLSDRLDPEQSSDAAARLARDNKIAMERALGRSITPGEFYLAHQQGAGGALRLLSNPDALASDVVGPLAASLNAGTPGMTAGDFVSKWNSKFEGDNQEGGAQVARNNTGLLGGSSNGGLLGGSPASNALFGDEGFLSPDRRDRMIVGLQGMTLNPNQAMQQAASSRIQGRAEKREAQAVKNKTIEWLRGMGKDDLAAGVESGAIPAQAAVQSAMSAPAAQKGVEINGRLVNPVTGELIADFSEEDETTTAVRGLQQRAALAGLEPDSDAYKQFMIKGGADAGMALNVSPDGTVQFAQGGAEIKPLNEGQSKAATYATRAEGALSSLDEYDESLLNRWELLADMDPTGLARELQSPEFQLAKQAGDEFLQALLRKDTGATITNSEESAYGKVYLPRPGDGPALLEQKRQARSRALEGMKAGMSPEAILAQERALAASTQEQPLISAEAEAAPSSGIPNFEDMSDEELDAYILKLGGE